MKHILSYLFLIVTLTVAIGSAFFVPDSVAESSEKEKAITKIDNIVANINSNSNYELTFLEYFTPSNKNSSHYRTEFRLSAFDNAIGMSYSIKGYPDAIIDFVAIPSYKIEIR